MCLLGFTPNYKTHIDATYLKNKNTLYYQFEIGFRLVFLWVNDISSCLFSIEVYKLESHSSQPVPKKGNRIDFQKKLCELTFFKSDFVLFTAGKPNPALFPFSKATFETDDGQKFEFKGAVMKEALQYQNSLVSFRNLP